LDAVVAQSLLHTPADGHTIDVDVPDDLPHVHVDPGLLERVIANLVANAQAASPPDRPIRLLAEVTDDRVKLHVIDHGTGVPPAARERMFQPFQRLDDRATTTGLGLGLAIVDLGLPGIDGAAVVEGIRAWSTAPIIVLSARHSETVKVNALDAGADDYITQPFGMDELLARIRAALRRATPTAEAPVIVTDAFTIDLAAKRVTTPAGDVRLTPTEWHLLEALARHPGRLITHQQLLQEVWGPQYAKETNYLRVHLANLRRKLEPEPPDHAI
jgi:two-component system KDP operon response regulator KdpE